MARRQSWGSIRKLNSGRYQARYRFEGIQYTGPTTFRTKSEANAWLAGVRVDLDRGAWIDPDAGSISLADFATAWLAERPGLRPRTRELYESELRLHILPVLGDLQLRQLSSARVRSWHAEMSKREKPGPTTVAKCYRLLRAVLTTAVEDELILKNPCVLKRAGVENAPERPIATIEQVYALADAIEPRFRDGCSWRRSPVFASGNCALSVGASSTSPGRRFRSSSKRKSWQTARCWSVNPKVTPVGGSSLSLKPSSLTWRRISRCGLRPGAMGLSSAGRRASRCGGRPSTEPGLAP